MDAIPPIPPLSLSFDNEIDLVDIDKILAYAKANPAFHAVLLQHLMFKPGDEVTWSHVARGGYGFITPVPAKVVSVQPARVTVAVTPQKGLKVGDVEEKIVPHTNLKLRLP